MAESGHRALDCEVPGMAGYGAGLASSAPGAQGAAGTKPRAGLLFAPEPVLLISDLAAFAIAFALPAMAGMLLAVPGGIFPDAVALGLAAAAPLLFALAGLYRRSLPEVEEVRRLMLLAGLFCLADAALYLQPGIHQAPAWHLLAWPLFAGVAPILRTLLRDLSAMRGALRVPVVVLGSGPAAQEAAAKLTNSPVGTLQFLRAEPLESVDGRARPADGQTGPDTDRSSPDISKMGFLGDGPANAGEAAALARLTEQAAHQTGTAPQRITYLLVPGADRSKAARLAGLLARAGQPVHLTGMPERRGRPALPGPAMAGRDLAATLQPGSGRRSPAALAAKRAIDILAAGLLLTLLAPLFGALLMMIRADGGPGFFVQTRIGRNGVRFGCMKFRSMRPDAQDVLHAMLDADPVAKAEWDRHQKLRIDPRVTRVGRFLRETSLDELPQLINVLRGDMSLVGPRPIVAPEIPGYTGDSAYYHGPDFEHYKTCIPGITGLWQVSGRATTAHAERVRLDSWYSRNWSVWLDIVILLRTLKVLLRRSGS